MNAKNELIEKLLKVAKKHKVLTYPVLALVAVISVFNYFFSWSTGAGKRVVAVVMVLVMLVSQSYFLTSSANALVDDANSLLVQEEIKMASNDNEDAADKVSKEDTKDETKKDDADSSEQAGESETVDVSDDNAADNVDDQYDTGIIENVTINDPAGDEVIPGDSVDEDPATALPSEFTEDNETDYMVSGNATEDIKVVRVIFHYKYEDTSGTSSVSTDGQTSKNIKISGNATSVDLKTTIENFRDIDAKDFNNNLNDGCYTYDFNNWYTAYNMSTETLSGTLYSVAAGSEKTVYNNLVFNTTVKMDGVDWPAAVVNLYCGRTLSKYCITIKDNDGDYTVSDGAERIGSTNKYHVLSTSTVTISGAKKDYYFLSGYQVGNKNPVTIAEADRVSPATFNFTMEGQESPYVDVELLWTGKPYKIKYANAPRSSNPTSYVEQDVHYGSPTDKFLAHSQVTDKPGWEFNHWEYQPDASAVTKCYVNDVLIKDQINEALQKSWCDSGTVTLYPEFEYVEMKVTSEKTQYEFEYSAEGSGEFSVGYTRGSSERSEFKYSISADSPISESTLKGNYGIEVEQLGNKFYFKTDRAISVTPDGGITVTVYVLDNTDRDNNYKKHAEFDVNIIVKKKDIKIKIDEKDKPAGLTKDYDGTDACMLDKTKRFKTDSVYIVDGEEYDIEIEFTGSKFTSVGAGNAVPITLEGVVLTVPVKGLTQAAGPITTGWAQNYTFNSTGAVMGTILPREVYLDVKALKEGRDGSTDADWAQTVSVKAGKKNPDVRADNIQKEEGVRGLIKKDDNTYEDLGKITFEWNRAEADYEDTSSTYECKAKSCENTNYKVITRDNGKAYLTVYAEDPNTKYEIIGDRLPGNNWYRVRNVQIKKTCSDEMYDKLIVQDLDGNDIDLTDGIPDCVNKAVRIRLKNSSDGAVTAWKTETFNIDTKAPTYVKYTLTTTGEGDYNRVEDFYDDDKGLYTGIAQGGFFFPTKGLLDFGSFFKNNIRVTIEYNDNVVDGVTGSGVKNLHYRLKGASQYNTVQIPSASKSDGTTAFSFELNEVVANEIGEIEFYADDDAGNGESDARTLKRLEGATQWCVESTGPKLDQMRLYYGENQQEYDDVSHVSLDKYYSNCLVEAKVSDDLAGIYSIEWIVNNASDGEQRVAEADRNEIKKQYTFSRKFDTKTINGSGVYNVSAIITDNAGNVLDPYPSIRFNLDNVAPKIAVKDYDKWMQEAHVEFEVSDDASGVEYIRVIRQNEDGTEETIEHKVDRVAESEGGKCYCYFDQTIKGDYAIVAVDKAGNKTVKPVPLHYLSQEVPECPVVEVTPEMDSEKKWYNGDEQIKISIKSSPATPDGTSVVTYYQLWKDGETALNKEPVNGKEKTVEIPDDGHYHLLTWAESMTGVKCNDTHEYEFFVDKTAPVVEYTPEKGNGSTLIMRFSITDASSGVDVDSIKVWHDGKEIEAKGEKNGNAYVGSFEIKETGDYFVEAADEAGNVVKAEAFTPMSLKVNAVKNITSSSATVGAFVIKGTSDIQSASIAYRRFTDGSYVILGDDIAVKDDSTGNIALSAVLSDLDMDTPYVYKITATSELGEVLEYEGYFRTLAEGVVGVSVSGLARYADETKTGKITVGLFKGNVCNMATEIDAGDQFTFSNIPDGNYNIIATDGKYSKTMRILIDDGMVVYPENAIELVLSGKNTSVVITNDETPDITADNMDSIFEYDIVNYTNDDVRLVETEGGVVEFKLYATLITIASVSPEEIAAMYAVTDSGKIVGAYLDLSLVKETTDAAGVTERKKVTELGRGASVSVTIPLGDLAGKPGLEVVRIHNDGEKFLGQSLRDEDNNPGTYTISTNQFSTYAILYSGTPAVVEPEKPGTETPAPGTPSIVTPNVPAGTPQGGTNNTPDQGGTGNNDNPQKDDDKNKDKNKDNKKKPIKQDDSKRGEGNNGSSVGSLKSSGTAKTGDATPIEAMGTIMLISVAGIFVLRKKIK